MPDIYVEQVTNRDTFSSVSLALAALLLLACAKYSPPRELSIDFLGRAETQQDGEVSVSAVVLSDKESDRAFGTRMSKKDVQPVWLEIDNRGDGELLLMLLAVDPDYFSPSEAAWRTRRLFERRSRQKMEFFSGRHIPLLIPPKRKVMGYVFTNRDPGIKAFAVKLIGDRRIYSFDFVQLVPGLRTDFERARTWDAYDGQQLPDLDLQDLRIYLNELPCCVLGGDRKTPGDPLNIAVVGKGPHALATLVGRGWDLTETLRPGSALRTVTSSLFKSPYRTSPVSPLYLFGRSQDVALQKARGNVDERNHLRLWRAPVTHRGTPVWVGQISRDIGIKLTTKTVVTHKIDPEVDEARAYFMLDLISSPSAKKVGFVRGVGRADRDAPRYNYTRDPYVTDGLRVVLFLGEVPTTLEEIEWLDWEWPSTDSPGVVDEDPSPSSGSE